MPALPACCTSELNPPSGEPVKHVPWCEPPLTVLVHLAKRGQVADEGTSGQAGQVIWIGRCVWPYPPMLGQGAEGSC
ncbi:hypothetical protein ACERK3_08040 [Phycisphaerales bacterium AB-hyl4]|uniref:Uncharacterized protein n=1 Tax=Natronomicrosphaera hydrolytica TaxID=3242702 RepID=A0ABV4U3R7_9BACT